MSNVHGQGECYADLQDILVLPNLKICPLIAEREDGRIIASCVSLFCQSLLDAKRSPAQKHRIAVTEEPVRLADSVLIGVPNGTVTRKRRNQHQ